MFILDSLITLVISVFIVALILAYYFVDRANSPSDKALSDEERKNRRIKTSAAMVLFGLPATWVIGSFSSLMYGLLLNLVNVSGEADINFISVAVIAVLSAIVLLAVVRIVWINFANSEKSLGEKLLFLALAIVGYIVAGIPLVIIFVGIIISVGIAITR